ncbi:hypothetical protein M3Y99_00875700 [Aphelenchoides fujianensis]|nr:hypothetical protein M3Y99_00875700 [Aphelenchoides fujianensis]
MEETLSVSGESVEHADELPTTQRAAKRCKSGSGHEDHSSDDGIEIDSPPHKQLALLDGTATPQRGGRVDEQNGRGEAERLPRRTQTSRSQRLLPLHDLPKSLLPFLFAQSSPNAGPLQELHVYPATRPFAPHMLKQHQISRMFMCRCCNWAFPDKTSLHMHTQGKQDNRTVNVPVIGKGNPPIDSDESNGHRQQAEKDEPSGVDLSTSAPSLNGSLLGNTFGQVFGGGSGMPGGGLNGTAGMQLPAQPPQLFANMGANPLLNSLPNGNSGVGSNGLFPQLSSMQRDSADLISKLRQRLFFGGPPAGPLLGANGELNPADQFKADERFVAEMTEKNDKRNRSFNSLPAVVQEAANRQRFLAHERKERALGLQSSGSSPRTTQEDGPKDANLPNLFASNNLAGLMEMLNKNALAHGSMAANNNNNLLLTNNNKEETSDKNNNSNRNELPPASFKSELKAKRSSSAGSPSEQHTQRYSGTIEPISPANTNSSASPSNVSIPCFGFASLKSEGHSQCQDNHEAKNAVECGSPAGGDLRQIREHNEYLMQKLLKCRERQSEAARAEFLRDVLKITFLE